MARDWTWNSKCGCKHHQMSTINTYDPSQLHRLHSKHFRTDPTAHGKALVGHKEKKQNKQKNTTSFNHTRNESVEKSYYFQNQREQLQGWKGFKVSDMYVLSWIFKGNASRFTFQTFKNILERPSLHIKVHIYTVPLTLKPFHWSPFACCCYGKCIKLKNLLEKNKVEFLPLVTLGQTFISAKFHQGKLESNTENYKKKKVITERKRAQI